MGQALKGAAVDIDYLAQVCWVVELLPGQIVGKQISECHSQRIADARYIPQGPHGHLSPNLPKIGS